MMSDCLMGNVGFVSFREAQATNKSKVLESLFVTRFKKNFLSPTTFVLNTN